MKTSRITYNPGDFINGFKIIKDINDVNLRIRKAEFECFCGKYFICLISSVKNGNTKSCGCYRRKKVKERFLKHGLRKHHLYGTWKSMKTRCYNKARADYKYYGGRGIIISDEFLIFQNYYNYCISLPNYENREKLNLTIDRINNNSNYQKGNLQWATKQQQSLNQLRNT